MLMKLKTIEQIKEEYSDRCYYNLVGNIYFKNNSMPSISIPMFPMFGKVHKIEMSSGSYMIILNEDDDMYWYFHKDWFLSRNLMEFIDEKEMIV